MLRIAVLACVAMAATALPWGAGYGYAGWGGPAYAGIGYQIEPAPLNDPLAEYRNAEGTSIAAAQNGIARGQALGASTTANANNHADALASAIQFQSANQAAAAIMQPGHPNPSGMAIYGSGSGYAHPNIAGPANNIFPQGYF